MVISIPPISEWSSVHFTMLAYVIQGIFITILNVPLVILLLGRKQNRDRKEFVLIACVCMIDISYVLVNAWNSFIRLTTDGEMITRAECISQPTYFISLVVSQLVANMPLMVAFDRLIASLYGVWYYKRGLTYSLILCAIPILFSFVITIINSTIIFSTPAGADKVSSYCFTSSLPAPVFKMMFHSLKWICILLAGLVYVFVAIVLRSNTQNYAGVPNYLKRIRTANMVMGLSTVNSILFHLVPDFFLVVPLPFVSMTVFLQCILFSIILEKIMFNFVLFLVFHKELRTIYCQLFFRGPKGKLSGAGGSSSSTGIANSSRMFPEGCRHQLMSKIRSFFHK